MPRYPNYPNYPVNPAGYRRNPDAAPAHRAERTLSEHLAHGKLSDVVRLMAPRMEMDPSETTEMAVQVIDAALRGLERVPHEGEYVEAGIIADHLHDARDALIRSLRIMHPSRHRR